MTNKTAPERIWATYNDAFGINWQDGQFTTSEQPACGRYTPYVPEAELEAAQARIAELEGALRLAEADIVNAFKRLGFLKERSSTLTAIRAALEGKG